MSSPSSSSKGMSNEPNNLLMFRAALSNSFQDIAKCVSEEEFLNIFTMLESKKSLVKKLHKVMEEDLLEVMEQDLQEIVTDECLVEGMKTLSKLSEETTVPSDIKLWRPPGDVNLHLRSLDAEKIKNECEKLESYIISLKTENKVLVEKVTRKRENIQRIHDHMKQLLNMPFKLSELENTAKLNRECVEKLYDNVP
ncbi:uncharacterized protein LOC106637248 [Copidosoma floridanum]|uniref:uncharacterized protein LOC106637248 n=1 Tax=Copidosoma floridanum TaxID=29053 RepID=UPI0006C956A5|nr:uncharacterized protein LOC106637248 [Copidosoma floridanum]